MKTGSFKSVNSKGITYERIAYSSMLAASETNDCVVKAVASAFDMDYEEAHAWVKRIFDRRERQGTKNFTATMSRVEEAFGKAVKDMRITSYTGHGKGLYTYYRCYGRVAEREMTLQTFLKSYPRGVYIVVVERHAFTIKEGAVIGNLSDSYQIRKRLQGAFKVG